MYPVGQRFLDAIRHPPPIYIRVEVWRGGTRVDDFGDAGVPVYGGVVDVDPGKQVRRTLTGVKVDATDEMWNLLSPVGTELRVHRGFRYLNGETDTVPLGVFVVPDLSETYGGDWSGQIGSASDRMILVHRARFTTPRTFGAGEQIRFVIRELLADVLGAVNVLTSNTSLTTSPLLYERDVDKALDELTKSIGADVFIAPDGTPTIRDAPQLGESVWTVDAGEDGVLYDATRARSYQRTYSGVQAAPAQIDGAPPFPPVTVWDDDPTSDTYYLGPFGKVPYFLTSPLLGDEAQASLAAYGLLPRVTAPRAQLSLTAECNPALADGDTITVVLPARRRGADKVTERHLVGPFTVPLTPDGTQDIATASASPDIEDSQ